MGRTGKSTPKKKDQFCWICHKGEIQVVCSKCCRSFHNDCLDDPDSLENRALVCTICQQFDDLNENVDKPEIVPMIPKIIHFLMGDDLVIETLVIIS